MANTSMSSATAMMEVQSSEIFIEIQSEGIKKEFSPALVKFLKERELNQQEPDIQGTAVQEE